MGLCDLAGDEQWADFLETQFPEQRGRFMRADSGKRSCSGTLCYVVYQRDGEKMQSMPYSYKEMYEQLTAAYHEAAEANDALVADVGTRFYELADKMDLYAEEGIHPNETGSRIAAEIIAGVCRFSGI